MVLGPSYHRNAIHVSVVEATAIMGTMTTRGGIWYGEMDALEALFIDIKK